MAALLMSPVKLWYGIASVQRCAFHDFDKKITGSPPDHSQNSIQRTFLIELSTVKPDDAVTTNDIVKAARSRMKEVQDRLLWHSMREA